MCGIPHIKNSEVWNTSDTHTHTKVATHAYTGKVTIQLYVQEWANLGEWVLTWKGRKHDVRKRARKI